MRRMVDAGQRRTGVLNMAYDPNNLSALAYSNGFTLWHYKTADLAVYVAGYFNDAASMLRVGDFILTNASDIHRILVVTDNADGKVMLGSGSI